MSQKLPEVFWIQSVENIEEIVTRREFIFRKNIWKILLKLFVGLELRVEFSDREFIILRYFDVIYLSFLEQLLFAA